MPIQLNPYLSFKSNTREAVRVLIAPSSAARLSCRRSAKDTPRRTPLSSVYHAFGTQGRQRHRLHGLGHAGAHEIRARLHDPHVAERRRLSCTLKGYFEKLAAGATVTLPLEKAPVGRHVWHVDRPIWHRVAGERHRAEGLKHALRRPCLRGNPRQGRLWAVNSSCGSPDNRPGYCPSPATCGCAGA